jgi:hypothetical protein
MNHFGVGGTTVEYFCMLVCELDSAGSGQDPISCTNIRSSERMLLHEVCFWKFAGRSRRDLSR